MLRDEVEHAVRETGTNPPRYWVDAELHNSPDRLREALQHMLDAPDTPETVLMTFGKCGSAVTGLHTGNHTLILPRTDDCISMLLGSVKRRIELAACGGMYFLTAGWLRGKRNIWAEYEYAAKKYGERRAKAIMSVIFNNYKYIAALDTGSYDVEQAAPRMIAIAETFSLDYRIVPGSVAYLRDLLTGPWDGSRFVTFPPRSTVMDFRI